MKPKSRTSPTNTYEDLIGKFSMIKYTLKTEVCTYGLNGALKNQRKYNLISSNITKPWPGIFAVDTRQNAVICIRLLDALNTMYVNSIEYKIRLK